MLAPIPWLVVVLLLAGCATGRVAVANVPSPAPPPPPSPRLSSPGEGKELKGMASWYGRPHHGKRTASGETYDMNKLTAAHRTLPLGTRVHSFPTRRSSDLKSVV